MRVARLLGLVLALLTAGLLVATPAVAQPPAKLTDHVTDTNKVLTDSDRAAVSSAIDRLYRDRRLQLWVIYVDNFNKFKPDNWAEQTRNASGLGANDALLAVATNTKLYAFAVPPQVQGLTAAELSSLRSNRIEPAVGAKDWSGAAVAAADGLDKSTSSSKRSWLPIAIAVAAVVVVILLALMLYRVRRRRRAAQRVDAGSGQVTTGGPDRSLPAALSTADARLRQITDYVAKHRANVGAEALARVDEAKRQLAAARGKQATNEAEAIAHANMASTQAAQAQELANADVRAAHGPRPRGTPSAR